MAKEDCFFDKAFGVLKDNTGLTEQHTTQKAKQMMIQDNIPIPVIFSIFRKSISGELTPKKW